LLFALIALAVLGVGLAAGATGAVTWAEVAPCLLLAALAIAVLAPLGRGNIYTTPSRSRRAWAGQALLGGAFVLLVAATR
jgi:hypothetical protein